MTEKQAEPVHYLRVVLLRSGYLDLVTQLPPKPMEDEIIPRADNIMDLVESWRKTIKDRKLNGEAIGS